MINCPACGEDARGSRTFSRKGKSNTYQRRYACVKCNTVYTTVEGVSHIGTGTGTVIQTETERKAREDALGTLIAVAQAMMRGAVPYIRGSREKVRTDAGFRSPRKVTRFT